MIITSSTSGRYDGCVYWRALNNMHLTTSIPPAEGSQKTLRGRSMRRVHSVVAVIAAVSITILTLGAMSASAAAPMDDFEKLLLLNQGTTAAEMREAVTAEASRTGRSEREVVREALAKAEESILPSAPVRRTIGGPVAPASSGGDSGGTSVYIGCSDVGNFLYSYASTGPVTHGHNGLYGNFGGQCGAFQAMGQDYNVAWYPYNSSVKTHPSYKARVLSPNGVTATQRTSAQTFATSKIGKPYNSNFAFNRTVHDSKYNCSQLVWAAWMDAKGLDLDKDAGWGVYPVDLRDSPKASFVRWL